MQTDDERLRIRELVLGAHRAFLPTCAMGAKTYYASDVSGQAEVHLLNGAENPRLTGDNRERHLPVAGSALGLLIRHDSGGNEIWQLSLLGTNGEVTPVTHDARAKHENPVVAPDGRRVGLARNPDGQDDMVLSVLDLESGKFEDWATPGAYWLWESWSPDGRLGAVIHLRSPTRLEAYLVDAAGTLTRILPSARRVADITWLDDQRIVALTDHDSEYMLPVEIRLDDLRQPARRLADEEHDFEAFVVEPRTRGAAVAAVNEGAYDSLRVYDFAAQQWTRQEMPFPGVLFQHMSASPANQIAWHDAGNDVTVAWETPTRPAALYELFSKRRLAGDPNEDELSPHLYSPTTTSYTTFDKLAVPALSYRIDDGPRDTVVYFHGGPESQIRGNFQPLSQLLLLSGLNVFAPNVRGSTGYGIAYFSLDDRTLRWDSVRDGSAAARHLRESGAAPRTAALGRSYGGFMTLAVLVDAPELWDAAVEYVGIADWVSFLRNTGGWRRAMRIEEYGDPNGDEAEFLHEISPLHHASHIRCPLLVIHGRNDPRVPVGETEQIARATGAELLIFEDEGHGISREENVRTAYKRTVEFLVERLRTRETAPVTTA